MIKKLKAIVRHLWLDVSDTRQAIPPAMVERLAKRVAASERHHSGEIRVSVEAGLPLSYLWQGLTARDRALTLFGKLRVWDTEQNNGVLIYLLLADHAIEIVADRWLTRHVPPAQWQALIAAMQPAFRAGRFEDGLNQAIATIDALLMQHFALAPGQTNPDELPNRADLR